MSASDKSESLAPAASERPRTKTITREPEHGMLRSVWLVARPVWSLFTSVRLALILILLVTAAVLAGTLLMQVPASVASDPVAYDNWLADARSKYGIWTDVLRRLQFFDVFGSPWFQLLVGLITVNIVVCTLNRWKGIWTTVFRTRVRMGDAFFEHARFSVRVDAAMPAPVAAERVQRAFSRARYRVQTEVGDDSIAILADRNRFSRFGTFVSHLSLILILVGTLIGVVWKVSDDQFIVAEGETRELGLGTNISVQLEHFVDEYYLSGPPKDFYSDLVIYDNGVEVKRATARVNTPVGYEGFKFHQSFFGQAAVMEVRDKSEEVLFSEGVPLAYTLDGVRPAGRFTLPAQDLSVWVIGSSQSGYNDELIPAGEMLVQIRVLSSGDNVTTENLVQGTAQDLAGLEFTFQRERRFTGLKVVKDPGVKVIWVASTLMIVGLAMLFYFPHRRVWALCKRRLDGTSEVLLGAAAERDLSMEQEFGKLRGRVRLALGIADEEADFSQGDKADV